MKKLLLIVALFVLSFTEMNAQTYEYKIVTSIESVVPMGLGRSRIISENEDKNYTEFTSKRTKESKKQNKSDRGDAKVDDFEETKLMNFYSAVGINFQNVASNDAILSSKVNTMVSEGWDLAFVTSGVESDGGKGDSKGIFITRYIFKRLKQ